MNCESIGMVCAIDKVVEVVYLLMYIVELVLYMNCVVIVVSNRMYSNGVTKCLLVEFIYDGLLVRNVLVNGAHV